MAAATTIPFSKLKVLLGDGASPEVFTAPCGFNSRAFNRSKSLREDIEPDCDEEAEEEEDPAWVARTVESLSWNVTGEGVLPEESVAMWEAFFNSAASRNVRVELIYPGSIGTIAYTGKAHLQTYNIAAERGGKVTKNIDLQGDGALVPAA